MLAKAPDIERPSLQAAGVELLRAILAPILLRRTKRSLIDGRPIVALPPRCGTAARAVLFMAHVLWLCRVFPWCSWQVHSSLTYSVKRST